MFILNLHRISVFIRKYVKKALWLKTSKELTEAIKTSCEEQKKISTFIEVILNQELGEPFRRDAMKKPVQVAGINSSDMQN